MMPEIVLGPPGTGKTTELLSRVEASLANGTDPERIAYVTFTKRGANEAIERAMAKFNLSRNKLRYFRTLHSLCFQAAGLSNGDVFEGKKVVEFGDWLGIKLSESVSMDEGSTFGYNPGDRGMFMENLSRIKMIPLRQLYDRDDDALPWDMVERLSRGLVEYKRAHSLVDYTDMLSLFVKSEWSPALDELYVDEAQDLSLLQWKVVEKLARGCKRVVIAGDDDQAIYKWAGADVDHFVDMEGHVKVLTQSWRVPRTVQQLSDRIISQVHKRRPKEWNPRPEDGKLIRTIRIGEVDLFDNREILILGRNTYVLKPVMRYLQREGVVYDWKGHSSVSKVTLNGVMAWEALRADKTITADEARQVYTLMSTGKGVKRGFKTLPGFGPGDEVSMRDLVSRGGLLREDIWHEALDRIPEEEKLYMLRARKKGESLLKKPRVRVSTIHGSKGAQGDHVILFRDMAPKTYAEMIKFPEDEARAWYVAVTRTRVSCTIVAPATRLQYPL
jgi:DNA helicase-2/ATP-dependent DNA helicase PcrA